jgi:hypothetical protein
MKLKALSQNVALFVGTLLVVCILAEIALRAMGIYGAQIDDLGAAIEVDDDVVPFRGRPNAEYMDSRYGIPVTRNSKGWRDYEYAYEKAPGVFRIVVLGDSVLNAHGIHQEDVYAKVLETKLNQSGEGDFEVIMLSLGALNTTHEAHLLDVEGVKYDPDLVLVGYVLNDPEGGPVKTRKSGRVSGTQKVRLLLKQSSLIMHTWMLVKRSAWQVADWNLGFHSKGAERLASDYYAEIHNDKEKWQGVVEGFRKISGIVRERNIPGVVVIFPVLHRLDDYPWAEVHSKVTSAAEGEGLIVFDLLPVLKETPEKEVRLGPGDYIHPNSLGHKLTGEAVYDFLQKEGLLLSLVAFANRTRHRFVKEDGASLNSSTACDRVID